MTSRDSGDKQNDNFLIAELKSGDERRSNAALIAIWKKYGPLLLTVISRYHAVQEDIEEIVVGVMIELVKKVDVVASRKLSAWLWVVAKNIAVTKARSQISAARRKEKYQAEASEMCYSDIELVYLREHLQRVIDQVCAKLSPRQLLVLYSLRELLDNIGTGDEIPTRKEIALNASLQSGTVITENNVRDDMKAMREIVRPYLPERKKERPQDEDQKHD